MEKHFVSGVPYTQIVNYLKEELALKSMGAGAFCYKNAVIRIVQMEPRALGNISLPRNEIKMQGDATDIQEFEHVFLMRFLSAGG